MPQCVSPHGRGGHRLGSFETLLFPNRICVCASVFGCVHDDDAMTMDACFCFLGSHRDTGGQCGSRQRKSTKERRGNEKSVRSPSGEKTEARGVRARPQIAAKAPTNWDSAQMSTPTGSLLLRFSIQPMGPQGPTSSERLPGIIRMAPLSFNRTRTGADPHGAVVGQSHENRCEREPEPRIKAALGGLEFRPK